MTVQTDATGHYHVGNLATGVYTICELLPDASWTETYPTLLTPGAVSCSPPPAGTAPVGYSVTIDNSQCCTGQNVIDKDFGNNQVTHKTGMKFEDTNGNGQKDAGEPAIPGWPITLTPPVGPPVTVNTAADGTYSFPLTALGTYTVCEGVSPLPGTWVQSFPNALHPIPFPNAPNEIVINTCPGPNTWGYQFDVTASTGDFTDNDFGNYRKASKSGTKFNDVANDGTPPFEGTLDGWTIKLFGTDGLGNPVSLSTVTGPAGAYSFPGLNPGTYTVCEVLQATWTQTYPNPGTDGTACETAGYAAWGYTFTLVSGQNETGNDFANHKTEITCNKPTMTGVMLGMSNGPDLTVNTWLAGDPGSVQWAVDNVTDTTGDGKLVVLVIAHQDGSLGGTANQKVVVSATYLKPFALFGCSVTLTGGGTGPAVWIKDSATSPGWGLINGRDTTIFTMDVHGGNSAVGVEADGTKRYIRNTYGRSNNGPGIVVRGDNNTVHNGNAGDKGAGNTGNGVEVYGSGNLLTDTTAFANTGNGFYIEGSNNQLLKLNAGDKGKGNSQSGVVVKGSGNQLTENVSAYNTATGFTISGTDPADNNNKLKKNQASSNTGIEFVIGKKNVDQLENKKNGTKFTFKAAGGNFN